MVNYLPLQFTPYLVNVNQPVLKKVNKLDFVPYLYWMLVLTKHAVYILVFLAIFVEFLGINKMEREVYEKSVKLKTKFTKIQYN